MAQPAPESLRPLDSELELGERLGNGAMGSVYRARERSSGREVALKILHAETAAAASRFVREGQVTAGLQHPGVVRVHAIGSYGGRPCLTYELVAKARSFEEAIEDEPGQALGLLVQAGQALGAAHALGLTHRDVKSENLLVDASGRLRVTDFGLVTGEELARLTQSGAWVGTPLSMAPEQFGARQRIGPATDVWALGVLLYRSLTGVYPFLADSMLGIASAITAGHFERPSRVRATPAPLEAVCLRALSPLPEDRYPDGAAFAAALEEAIAEGEGQTSRLPYALLALGLLALLGATFAVMDQQPEPRASAPTRPPTGASSPSAAEPRGSLEGTRPAATPDPERDLFADARAWSFRREGPGPVPAEILNSIKSAGPEFNRNLVSLRAGSGATTQIRTARALLSGAGVRRDPEAALRILRHAASGNRSAEALLLETLSREGKHEEELLWLARMALNVAEPLEVHRLWQIGRDPSDSRAQLAKKVWRAIPPEPLRANLLIYLEGTRAHPSVIPRSEDRVELREWVIDSALLAWSQDPSPKSDWELGAILDRLSDPTRLRLVQRGAPSRRLGTLCLRREARLGERARPEDLAVLDAGLRPTLPRADEEWLLTVVKALAATNVSPPCLAEVVERLGSMPGAEAQRWSALCRGRGFGVAASPAALETLQRMHRQGDHEAGVLLYPLLGARPSPKRVLQLVGPGVQAGHPGSMFALAASYLHQGLQAPESAAHLRLLQRAAEAGNPNAQSLLGRLLDTSTSEPGHMQEAYRWTKRAAESDHLAALRRLALFQEAGFGCQPSLSAAAESLKRGALLGDAKAALALGQLLLPAPPGETKLAAKARHREVRRYLLRAKLQGLSQAASIAMIRHDLGHPNYTKRGYRELQELVARDPSRSARIELAKQLIARGELEQGERLLRDLAPNSTTALNCYLRHLREEGRDEEAEAFLSAGVETEIPHYLIAAGEERFPRDPAAGEALLLRAAKLGRPQAMVILGQRLWETERPKARRQAWQLWLRAHRAGNTSATRKLGAHEWPN